MSDIFQYLQFIMQKPLLLIKSSPEVKIRAKQGIFSTFILFKISHRYYDKNLSKCIVNLMGKRHHWTCISIQTGCGTVMFVYWNRKKNWLIYYKIPMLSVRNMKFCRQHGKFDKRILNYSLLNKFFTDILEGIKNSLKNIFVKRWVRMHVCVCVNTHI